MSKQIKIETLELKNKQLAQTLVAKNEQVHSQSIKLRNITKRYHALELSMYKNDDSTDNEPEYVAHEELAKLQLALLQANARNSELEERLTDALKNRTNANSTELPNSQTKSKNNESDELELSKEMEVALQKWARPTT